MKYGTTTVNPDEPIPGPTVPRPRCPACRVRVDFHTCRNPRCGTTPPCCAEPEPYDTTVDVWSHSTHRVVKRAARFCRTCGAEVGVGS